MGYVDTPYQMVSFALVCVCTLPSSTVKKKTIPAPSLDYISNLCRTDELFFGFIISIFWVFSMPGLDLLLKRHSIRYYVSLHQNIALLDLIDPTLRVKSLQNATKIITDLKSLL